MIFIYILCTLVCLLIAFFVLSPLAKSHTMLARTYDGFADESELRHVIEIRDALIARLVCGATDHPVVKQLNEASAWDALVNVCLRLQKAGLKFLPIFLLALIFAPTFSLAASPQFNIPESVIVNNRHVPRLHQFSLSGGEMALVVRYMGLFKNPTPAQTIQVLLPFPAEIHDLKISKQQNATLTADDSKNPVLTIENAPQLVEIQAEFTLDAKDGVARWRNNHHQSLPGTTLIMMNLYEGGVRNFLESLTSEPHIWPARFVNEPKGFTGRTEIEQYDPREPNYEMLAKLPPQNSRRLIRMNDDAGPFPEFEVVGIVPSRKPLYSLAVGFGLMIFASGFVALARQKSEKI